jgi:hypothetical protein
MAMASTASPVEESLDTGSLGEESLATRSLDLGLALT